MITDLWLAFAYMGGISHYVITLPDILRYYIPRKHDGKWRIEGVKAVTFTPAEGASGASNHAMLRRYGNTLTGAMLVGHEKDARGMIKSLTFRVVVPAYRHQWAIDLLAYNGSLVEGLDAAKQAARHAHGLPQSWADSGGWEGLRARQAAKQQGKREWKPRGKAGPETRRQRIARLFDE